MPLRYNEPTERVLGTKKKRKMKILSLFDGISCGMLALQRAGIEVERYDAYEIEKSAIAISKKNYPNICHWGNIYDADFSKYNDFDLLIGGSPCTYWSIARKDRETTSSGIGFNLFMQFVKAKEQSGCTYFLYENNNSISREIKEAYKKMQDAIKRYNEVIENYFDKPLTLHSEVKIVEY